MIRHRSMIHARCPHGAWDYYTVMVEPRAFVTTERLEEVLDTVRGAEGYQEDLAQRLAAELDATVTLTGRHGVVDTEVIAS